MPKASEMTDDKNISLLFKGPFGFGKTLAACSFALEGPVYLSYWDKKKPVELLTYFVEKRFGKKAKTILDNIEYDVYDSSNPNEYLNKLIKLTKDCRYFAIINDSITFMTTSAVGWSLNFGKDNQTFKKIKDVLPDFDEYKVETSLVTQCLDLSKLLPCHVIWTAHPLSTMKVEGSGSSMKVSKVNSIVSYGSKVGSIVPGAFTEVYHFSKQVNYDANGASNRYICSTEAIGDEYAKSPLLGHFIKEFDFTDDLFYEVWERMVKQARASIAPVETAETLT